MTSGGLRVRIAAAAALAVMAAGLTGCDRVAEPPAPPIDPLAGMLLSETEVNAIVAPTVLTETFAYRTLFDLEPEERYTPAECLAVSANTMTEVFDGSGHRKVRGTMLDDEDGIAEIDQGVIEFDSPAAAQAFVDRTVATWHRCAGGELTIADDDPEPWVLTMEAPQTHDDVEFVRVRGDYAYESTHAMRAVGTVVVDVRASHRGVSEYAVAVVNAVAGRSSL